MENRKKFYPGGIWGDDTLKKRFDHIRSAIEAYNNGVLDQQDLKFVIKNAFVSKIYASSNVVKEYKEYLDINKYGDFYGDLTDPFRKLVADGKLDLYETHGSLNTQYLMLGEFGTLVSRLKNNGRINKNKPSVRIEHIIPGNVYFNFDKKGDGKSVLDIASQEDFEKIFNVIGICLVTDGEDRELSKKHLRQSMPENVSDFMENPFARYREAKITIYERKK